MFRYHHILLLLKVFHPLVYSVFTFLKAAASCYIDLIVKESDNNVKLIVLDRLSDLRLKHEGVLDDLVMDVLRVLTSPDIEVRKKCLDIALEMICSRNVDEVVTFLRKELVKTHDQDYEKVFKKWILIFYIL